MDASPDLKLLLGMVFSIPMLIGFCHALDLEIGINENIKGNIVWLNFTDEPGQITEIAWLNSGSVDCESRARIDFYKDSRRFRTVWSSPAKLPAGEETLWYTYAYLPVGFYNMSIRIYQCNEILNPRNLSFIVHEKNPVQDVVQVQDVQVLEDYLIVHVKSSKDIEDVVVAPGIYPVGWILESGKIDRIDAGGTGSVRIGYNPVWYDSNVEFIAFTMDGEYAHSREFALEKPKVLSLELIVFSGIVAVIAVSLIFLYFVKTK